MALPKISIQFEAATEPLLERVPSCDEFGKPLSDLMILLPGMRDKPKPHITRAIQDIQAVLVGFPEAVVFPEFNVQRNLLWVSVRPYAAYAQRSRARSGIKCLKRNSYHICSDELWML